MKKDTTCWIFIFVGLIFGVLITRLSNVNMNPPIASIDELKALLEQDYELVDVELYAPGKTGFERANVSWDDEDENDILACLLSLKMERDYVAFNKEYKLILFFCDGQAKNVKSFEVWFDVMGGNFLCEYGISEELGEYLFKFLPEKKVLFPTFPGDSGIILPDEVENEEVNVAE